MSGLLDIVVYFLGEDKDVVHIDDDPSFAGFKYEEVVHHKLKGGRRVAESKKHYGGFKESFVGFEGRFPLISIFDTDIVISPSDVQFGEIFGAFEFVNEFGD